ncbi:hypothetical protein COV14_03065 [Candidatus Woesearchaeota archaeon CG10_big_fil_rev_8_21_14_0_10_33_12]|nr:MAG: hypothetical protein COV14_03065 [Candidatus Woesearchaeota archaeon CG10_big_fil_rev_8_21_14_0_10_33_12]
MELKLLKKPKNPTLIVGFPGFGLVGTISTEFLIDHLDTEQIGRLTANDMPAIVAIHENKVVDPLGIFYNKKHNIVILHAISAVAGIEWKLAESIVKIVNELGVKEIISLEGVGSAEGTASKKTRVFYYTKSDVKRKLLDKLGIEPLKEGIIMGVTGALLLRIEKRPVSCFFAETETNMPDSKAAAKIIESLDKYMSLKVDTKPLLEQATKFEDKLRGIMSKSKAAEEMSEAKKLSYVG